MRLSQLVRAAPARALPAALVLAAAARGAAAQTAGASPDARWSAWYGCWSPALDSASLAGGTLAGRAPTTCVTPAGGSAVDVTTVAGGKVVSRERVDAGGGQQERGRDGTRRGKANER